MEFISPWAKVHLKHAKQNEQKKSCSPRNGDDLEARLCLYEARTAHWKYNTFKDYLVIFKISFLPENPERVWRLGKRRLPELPVPAGPVTVPQGIECTWKVGRNGRQAPPLNLKGALSAPVPGSQQSHFLIYWRREVASSLLP